MPFIFRRSSSTFNGLSIMTFVISFVALQSAFADCKRLVVSADPEYPPFAWYDGKTLRGTSIDVTTSILRSLKIPYEVHYMGPFLRVLKRAENGDVDIIAELKNTPERRVYLDYTETPIFSNEVSVFVRKNNPIKYKTWSDLAKYRGGITIGNKFGGGFDEFLTDHLKIEEAPHIRNNFEKLASGRIDYFINSYYPAIVYLITDNLEKDFVALQPPITSNNNFVGWSKKSSCLSYMAAFDKALTKMIHNGETSKILELNMDAIRKKTVSIDQPAILQK